VTADGVGAVVQRARVFVDAHGDALQRARAAVLAGEPAHDAVESQLGDCADPRGALRALAVLDALRVRRGRAVERAAAVLAAAQQPDGSWRLGDEADEAAAIATTAAVAGLLAKTPCVRLTVLDAAAAWLAARWGPERAQGGDVRLIGGYAGFFANFDHELSDPALQWCGRELERGFRSGALDALAVARVFAFCDARGLPGAQLDASEVVLSLLASQGADGGFAPALPETQRIEATLDALAALGRLAPAREPLGR